MNGKRVYAALRKHLNSLPVGFPRSPAGLRILRKLFSEAEASAALGLDWRFRSAAQVENALDARNIDPRVLVREAGFDTGDRAAETKTDGLEGLLRSMAAKGSILMRATDGTFALLPFIVGMYEMQVAHFSRELCEDTTAFMHEGYGLEMLTTGEAQTRVIPIGAALRPEHRVADYDEFRSLIRGAGGRIAVVDCICRKAADLAGEPCKATDRRELCMAFRDYADTILREGWGRALSEEEALALADLNQREGLVMQPSNEREPQFLCACCGDCCGLLSVVKAMKRPADFVSTNHRAALSLDACVGCGACARICPMEAIVMDGPPSKPAKPGDRAHARVLEGRCIGCGVCVAACKFEALSLESLPYPRVPPRDTEELFERLASSKPSLWRKLRLGVFGILGLRTRPRG